MNRAYHRLSGLRTEYRGLFLFRNPVLAMVFSFLFQIGTHVLDSSMVWASPKPPREQTPAECLRALIPGNAVALVQDPHIRRALELIQSHLETDTNVVAVHPSRTSWQRDLVEAVQELYPRNRAGGSSPTQNRASFAAELERLMRALLLIPAKEISPHLWLAPLELLQGYTEIFMAPDHDRFDVVTAVYSHVLRPEAQSVLPYVQGDLVKLISKYETSFRQQLHKPKFRSWLLHFIGEEVPGAGSFHMICAVLLLLKHESLVPALSAGGPLQGYLSQIMNAILALAQKSRCTPSGCLYGEMKIIYDLLHWAWSQTSLRQEVSEMIVASCRVHLRLLRALPPDELPAAETHFPLLLFRSVLYRIGVEGPVVQKEALDLWSGYLAAERLSGSPFEATNPVSFSPGQFGAGFRNLLKEFAEAHVHDPRFYVQGHPTLPMRRLLDRLVAPVRQRLQTQGNTAQTQADLAALEDLHQTLLNPGSV